MRLRLALLLPFLAACSQGERDDRILYPDASVVIVTLDTTRADRLGCYGYKRHTTPNLDALAKECVRFEMAFAQSSFTPPSHASILTGRYPSSHGLTWWDNLLPDAVVTLAEVLRDAGRKTAMFSGLGMGRGNALDQGFERVVENKEFDFKLPIAGFPDYRIPPGNVINEMATRWLTALGTQKFFTWVHYYDAHRPYAIFAKQRAWGDPRARFGDDTSGDYQLDPKERAARGIGEEQAKILQDRYDSGLVDLDAKLGALIAHLRQSGQLEKTILVITADHGEAFTEYDEEWFTHDPFLFDAVTHVPLLIRFPDGRFAGQAVPHLAQLVDVMPTLLDYLGLPRVDFVQGVSLRPAIEKDQPVNDYVAAERRGRARENVGTNGAPNWVEYPPERIAARRSLRWKTQPQRIVVEQHGNQFRLFLVKPGEPEREQPFDPESTSGKGQSETYRKWVERIEAVKPDINVQELSPEQLRDLQEQGYIGR